MLVALLAGALLWLRFGEAPPSLSPAAELILPADPLDAGGPTPSGDVLWIDRRVREPAPGLQQITLRREEVAGLPRWWLEAPRVRADDESLEALWQALRAGRVLRRLQEEGGARRQARYGLAGDDYRVQVRSGGHTLRLGEDTADGEVYAARDAEPDVLVVEGRLRDLLSRPRAALTRTALTLLDSDADPVLLQRIDIGALTLVRRPSSWLVQERALPPGADRPLARARASAVTALLQMLREAHAQRVLDDGGVLRPAPLTVRLNGTEQFATGLPCPADTVGGPALSYVIRADHARLCFAAAALAPLTLPYQALRELRLVPFALTEIKSLRLLPPGGAAVELRRQDGGWLVGAARADNDAVDAYLDEVLALSGTTTTPAPPPRATPAPLVLEVETTAGDRLRLEQRGAQVIRDQEEPLQLAAADAERLRAGGLRFARRQLLSFPLYDVTTLTIDHHGAFTEVLTRSGTAGPLAERLRVTAPAAAPADAERLTRALGALADLRVLRVLDEATARGLLAAPRATITITTPGQSHRVLIGAALPGGQDCAVQVAAQSGVLPAALCADLLAPLVTRAVLRIDDARLQRVTLRGPARGALGDLVLVRTDRPLVLPALRLLAQAEVAGYGPPPPSPPLLTIEVEQAPLAAGAQPLSDVPPPHQVLTLRRDPQDPAGALLGNLAGRAVAYRIPSATLADLIKSRP